MDEFILLETKKAIFTKKKLIVKSKKSDIIIEYSNHRPGGHGADAPAHR